jgi:GNAT superfamily N-acetyltransferase
MDAGVAPASELIDAMVAEMLDLYADVGGIVPATVEDFAPPNGAYLVGFADGIAVCGGGLKRLDDDAVEIKRMYVVPAARRQGLARRLLGALEAAARERGYRIVRLDTGPRQPHAKALYTATGYVEVADYNDNPYAAYWGQKRLA